MDWSKQTAVVTGAGGFIGSHLVEDLVKRGSCVRALTYYDARGGSGWLDDLAPEVLDRVEVVAGDIRDTEMMCELVTEGSVVFHLAALIGIPYSYHAPRSYVETNTVGTLNMLQASRNSNARRVMVMSTSEVYGTALTVPITENHPLQAQSPYSASKIAAEKLAESFYKSFDLPVTVVRPFNTYGPRQSARAVIPTILMQVLNGANEIALGDPTTTRDFNYVEDTVSGLVRLAECDDACGEVVNIGTGVDISIADVVDAVSRTVGRAITIKTDDQRIRPDASEVRRLCADNSRLESLTGWTPPHRIEDGLKRTAEWMRGQLDRYEAERYYI